MTHNRNKKIKKYKTTYSKLNKQNNNGNIITKYRDEKKSF